MPPTDGPGAARCGRGLGHRGDLPSKNDGDGGVQCRECAQLRRRSRSKAGSGRSTGRKKRRVRLRWGQSEQFVERNVSVKTFLWDVLSLSTVKTKKYCVKANQIFLWIQSLQLFSCLLWNDYMLRLDWLPFFYILVNLHHGKSYRGILMESSQHDRGRKL